MALTTKQRLFVSEYLVDLNATAASLRAGYSCGQVGRRLLGLEKVKKAIADAISERSKRIEVNADYVLKRLVEIDQMDCQDILTDTGAVKPVSEWPKIWRQFISGFDCSELFTGSGEEKDFAGVLKKIKWPDKVKNLELIGRHINVQAFSDKSKLEHSGPGGGPLEIIRTIIRPNANQHPDSGSI